MTAGNGIAIVRTVADLRARIGDWRAAGQSIGLVPTMGSLHEGHLTLVRQALATTDRVSATLFVNPAQFGPTEDFGVYPRDEARDAALLATEGAHLLFAPDGGEMYPEESATRVHVPGLGDRLEGEFRPGFFTGVATVVAMLLIQATPDVAIFGEKDYQQLQVIRRMAADLHLPVRIDGAPTVREDDGLALSSRNAYLTDEERRIAPALHRTIGTVAGNVARGEDPAAQETWAAGILERCGFRKVDYVAVRDAETIEVWTDRARPARVLAAAWLGRARLIDNVAVE